VGRGGGGAVQAAENDGGMDKLSIFFIGMAGQASSRLNVSFIDEGVFDCVVGG
jgi:hypothetical protein